MSRNNAQSSNGVAFAAEEADFGASTAAPPSVGGITVELGDGVSMVFEVTIVMNPLPWEVSEVGVFEASSTSIDGESVGIGSGGIIGEFSQVGLVSSLSKHVHPFTTPWRHMPRPEQLAGQNDLC